jgi:dipeptidase E
MQEERMALRTVSTYSYSDSQARIGEDFVGWKSPTGNDRTLGVVDFSIFPHLDHPALPENTMADAERWAASMSAPCYAIDDETAIKVVDGTVEVVSEGHWKLFTP